MTDAPVRVIIVNYNGGADLDRCLDSLRASSHPVDIVVIDNGSTDGSTERVARRDDARLVRLDTNLGFPANNVELATLGDAPYVALLNPDVFVSAGWLEPLVELLDADPTLGAACPKIRLAGEFVTLEVDGDAELLVGSRDAAPRPCHVVGDAERQVSGRWHLTHATVHVPAGSEYLALQPHGPTRVAVVGAERAELARSDEGIARVDMSAGRPRHLLQNVGSDIAEDGYGSDRGFGRVDDGSWDEPVDVDAWCGAAVLLRTAYLDDVGLFDERFFLYYEDTDLSWRGRRRGWRYRSAPASVVEHRLGAIVGVGSDLGERYSERNRLLMLAKNAPVGTAIAAAGRHLRATAAYAWRDIARPLIGGRRPHARVVRNRLWSFASACTQLPSVASTRRQFSEAERAPVEGGERGDRAGVDGSLRSSP